MERFEPGHSLTIFFLALSGCASFTGGLEGPERSHNARFEGGVTSEESTLFGSSPPELGVALSGGGLRAAFYATGALAALHEKGVLQRTRLISTVSGGGYAGYYIYSSQVAADRKVGHRLPFGDAVFSPPTLPVTLCHLVTNANFVSLPSMLGAALTGRSVQIYDRRIGEVFGAADTGLTMPQTGALAREGYPYLIVNATVSRSMASDWSDGLYEFTGSGTRGAGRGEAAWSSSDANPVTYRQAVGISGAAFAPFLKQTIAEPPGSESGVVTLYDGGASENLGAIALIRRAVSEIVIVDAEHDPKYAFDAYLNLKRRLPKWGADIVIRGIEDHLASKSRKSPEASYFSGEAIGQRADGSKFTSRIHYLKMSLGAGYRDRLHAKWKDDEEGPQSWRDFNAGRMASYTSPVGCAGMGGRPLDLATLSEYAVDRYGSWWNGMWQSKMLGGFMALGFPQYSTADQSMYVDQAPAFVGLGYLQARLMPVGSGGAGQVVK